MKLLAWLGLFVASCLGIVAVVVLDGLAWRQVRYALEWSGVPRGPAGEAAFWGAMLTGLPAVGLVIYAMGVAGNRLDK